MEDVFIHNEYPSKSVRYLVFQEYPSQSVRYLSAEGKFLVDYGIL